MVQKEGMQGRCEVVWSQTLLVRESKCVCGSESEFPPCLRKFLSWYFVSSQNESCVVLTYLCVQGKIQNTVEFGSDILLSF